MGRKPPIIETGPATSPSGYTLPDEGSIAATEYGSLQDKSPHHQSKSEEGFTEPNIMAREKIDQSKSEGNSGAPAMIDFTGAADRIDRPQADS